MPFDLSSLRKVKYYPELLPGSDYYSSISADSPAVPPPIDLRRFAPLVVELTNINLNADPNLELEIKADKIERRVRAGSLNQNLVYPYRFIARDYLALNIYNIGMTAFSGLRALYGLWVSEPTIAEKLLHKWPLTQEENRLAAELNLMESVEKGVLPLPRTYALEREYQILNSVVFTRQITVPLQPQFEVVLQAYAAEADEFMVLTGFTCSNVDPLNYVILTIDRDDDTGYISFNTPAIGTVSRVSCWIPALNELRVTATATAAEAPSVDFTFEVIYCRLTNLLRARWHLVPADSIPGDTVKKVRGGVL